VIPQVVRHGKRPVRRALIPAAAGGNHKDREALTSVPLTRRSCIQGSPMDPSPPPRLRDPEHRYAHNGRPWSNVELDKLAMTGHCATPRTMAIAWDEENNHVEGDS
jgi:hypothetical protein